MAQRGSCFRSRGPWWGDAVGQVGCGRSPGSLPLEKDLRWHRCLWGLVGTLHLELGRLGWTEGALAWAPVRAALMTPLEHSRPWSLGTSGLGGHLGQLWGQCLCFSGNAGCRVVREDSRAPPGHPRLCLGEGLLVWVGGHPLSGVSAAALGSRERAVVCGTHPGPGSAPSLCTPCCALRRWPQQVPP